jgi:four helix bundle protein
MLRIYDVVLGILADLRPVLDQVAKRDADLCRQLRRASASVALNMAEGSGSRGGNRTLRYHSALGSMRETIACIEVAVAMGYVAPPSDDLAARMHRVVGTLVRLVR